MKKRRKKIKKEKKKKKMFKKREIKSFVQSFVYLNLIYDTNIYGNVSIIQKLGVLKFKDLYLFHIGINCYEYFNNKDIPTKLKDKFCKNVIE